MSRRPQSDPLGATPALPAPAGASARNVGRLFRRWVAAQQAQDEESTAVEAPPAPAPRSSRRTYAVALSKIADLVDPTANEDPLDTELGSQLDDVDDAGFAYESGDEALTDDVEAIDVSIDEAAFVAEPSEEDADLESSSAHPIATPDEVTQTQVVPVRPPPGAPTVRPPIRRTRPADLDRAALSELADSAMLLQQPDGSTAFDIAFDDTVLGNVACRIAVQDGKVTAVFHAPDKTTRRLLEAEAPRLRVALEDRGLRVESVSVDAEEA